MSTPTPRTDAEAFRPYRGDRDDEDVNADFARTLETEVTAALARIAELEKSRDLAREDANNNAVNGVRALEALEDLTRQLSEAQAQFRIAQNRVHWPEPPEDCIFCETYPATGSPQEVPMCKLCCLESERESLTAQLASAREDEKLYRELEISITDVQDWSGTRVGDALDAIDSARGVTCPDCAGEPCEKHEPVTSPLTPADTATESTWQPIETAPKDGTRVLLYGVEKSGEAYHLFEGWFDEEWWATFGNDDVHNVSHWQPLPPPPQGKEQ